MVQLKCNPVAADELQKVNKEDIKLLSENPEQQCGSSDSNSDSDSESSNNIRYYPLAQRGVDRDNDNNG